MITISSIVVSFCALFAYMNNRFLKLPHSVGVTVITLIFAAVVFLFSSLGLDVIPEIARITKNMDFSDILLKGMLNFLLFAGALHVNIGDLVKEKMLIALLAIFGVIISTFIIGYGGYYIFSFLGLEIDLIYCLLFGSLISPTDPIAVMAILRKAGVPVSIETQITGEALFGESLFNDGIGVVVFLGILHIVETGQQVDTSYVMLLFAKEFIGGLALGFLLGYLTHHLLRFIDNCEVEVLMTLAVVMGGYELSHFLETSGPIAMVVAGLMIGSNDKHFGIKESAHQHLDNFWEMIDEILNSVLFLLIGLEVLTLHFEFTIIAAALCTIPLVLFARFVTVSVPVSILRYRHNFSHNVIKILWWGGLRGGISVALALSLPKGHEREIIVIITYCVVLFSIIVQGLSIEKLLEKS